MKKYLQELQKQLLKKEKEYRQAVERHEFLEQQEIQREITELKNLMNPKSPDI